MYTGKRELSNAIEKVGTVKSFHECLFLAFLRADEENFKKLESVFQNEARTFSAWRSYGIDLSSEEVVI
jgi:hypothetical protein